MTITSISLYNIYAVFVYNGKKGGVGYGVGNRTNFCSERRGKSRKNWEHIWTAGNAPQLTKRLPAEAGRLLLRLEVTCPRLKPAWRYQAGSLLKITTETRQILKWHPGALHGERYNSGSSPLSWPLLSHRNTHAPIGAVPSISSSIWETHPVAVSNSAPLTIALLSMGLYRADTIATDAHDRNRRVPLWSLFHYSDTLVVIASSTYALSPASELYNGTSSPIQSDTLYRMSHDH